MRNTPPVGPAIILRMAIDCQAEKSLYESRSHRGTPPGNCNCVSVLRREASTANCSVEPRQIQTPSFRPVDPTLPTDRQHCSIGYSRDHLKRHHRPTGNCSAPPRYQRSETPECIVQISSRLELRQDPIEQLRLRDNCYALLQLWDKGAKEGQLCDARYLCFLSQQKPPAQPCIRASEAVSDAQLQQPLPLNGLRDRTYITASSTRDHRPLRTVSQDLSALVVDHRREPRVRYRIYL